MENPKNTANLPSPADCRHALNLLLNSHEEECRDAANYPLYPPDICYYILSILNQMLIPPPYDSLNVSYESYAEKLEPQLTELAKHCTNLSQFLEKALRYATIFKKSVDYAASHEPDHP